MADSLEAFAVRPLDSRLGAELALRGITTLAALTGRSLGDVVTDHRSSYVRRLNLPALTVFVKTYRYATWRERLRGVPRTTALARSRAAREHDALAWLSTHGFAGPRPLAVFEARQLGFLVTAVLVTQAWPGRDLSELLPDLSARECERCVAELWHFLEQLHGAGFRDGNFHLRNVLARPLDSGSFEFAKIDSPKFHLVAAGLRSDRRALCDRAQLSADLAGLPLSP